MLSRSASAALLVSAATVLGVLAVALWYAGHGFDPADEGFYLVWISEPGSFRTSVSQFGFVYHPLFELLGDDIAAVRRANLLLTAGLGVWVASSTLRVATGARRWVLAGCLGATALAAFNQWLVTPSYNSLTVQAALVVAAGAVAVWGGEASPDAGRPPRSGGALAGAVVLGVGGALMVLTKPTTAVAMALIVAVTLLLGRRLTPSVVAVTVAAAAGTLLVAALLMDGSPAAFADRLREGAEDYRVLGAGHTLGGALRLDPLFPSASQLVVSGVGAGAVAAAVGSFCWLAMARPADRRPALLLGAVALAGFAAAGIYRPTYLLLTRPGTALLLLAVPVACVAARLIAARTAADVSAPSRDSVVLACGLALLPLAGAFGSVTNYWAGACDFGILWLLAGVVVLGAPTAVRGVGVLVPLAVAGAVTTLLPVLGGMDHPYRQPVPVWRMDTPVSLAGGTVVLDPAGAALIGDLRGAAESARMPPGVVLVDLSGQFPALGQALGAAPAGSPWLIGGRPGSAAFLERSLDRLSCAEVGQAWLLVQPGGARAHDPAELAGQGITAGDVETVARIDVPEYLRGPEPTLLFQRPVRPPAEATRACEAARAAR